MAVKPGQEPAAERVQPSPELEQLAVLLRPLLAEHEPERQRWRCPSCLLDSDYREQYCWKMT